MRDGLDRSKTIDSTTTKSGSKVARSLQFAFGHCWSNSDEAETANIDSGHSLGSSLADKQPVVRALQLLSVQQAYRIRPSADSRSASLAPLQQACSFVMHLVEEQPVNHFTTKAPFRRSIGPHIDLCVTRPRLPRWFPRLYAMNPAQKRENY